ncbi:MAG: sigma-54-dependent Fis family transcriptional regulator, partial [Chloroflexi bacterium]|nr:sigma-54-dependent Fis family transcriptional regulator [Chloroflexota bacterium]
MRQGADDYVSKPFINDDLTLKIHKALERRALHRENRSLRQALRRKYGFDRIIGTSAAMQAMYALMGKVVETTANLMITGESGTGKELVAQAIHYHSGRSDQPFLAVACGALVENLLESELFGHVKGAFTGATVSKA